ncbi:hypothetical protein M378DRAFT_547775 [Amanita muscaria Koide BX008]|uniref:Uncharacterized protein n=1 Tax=Amanita muscaria (strain Koide BX008) TaxID=946122 RepID=A0A0C2W4J1_AMAMK|nr:hypothetical protein M378DRAFT_547775 [Amanita muscaria Koide BX008]
MAQVAQNNNNDLWVKLEALEAKFVSNGNTTPQIPLASVSNTSAADILDNRRKFFAVLLPHAASANSQYTELDPADYANVQYWDQELFNTWFNKYGKKSGPTPRGHLSKKLYFLEDENGNLISNNEASAMRKFLERKFSVIKDHMPDMLNGWLKKPTEFHDMVYLELRLLFPGVFQLCENNWKACEFTKNWYRNWSRDRSKKGIKVEDDDNEDDNDEREDQAVAGESAFTPSTKRQLVPEEELTATKKVKTSSSVDVKKTKSVRIKDPFTAKIRPTPRFKRPVTGTAAGASSTPIAAPASTTPEPAMPPSSSVLSSTGIAPAAAPASTTPEPAMPPSSSVPSSTDITPMVAPALTTPEPATPPSSSAPSSTAFAPTATPSLHASSSTTGSTTDLPSEEYRVVEPAPASPMETDEPFSLMAPVPEVNQAPPIAEEPVSTSFDDSQKKRAEDFKATAPTVTAGSEGTKILRGKGKGKGTSTNTGEGGEKQTKGSGRKARARANRNATTPMGLCKNEYLKSHKGASPEEFKAHWEGLDEGEKKKWEAQSAEIIVCGYLLQVYVAD